MLLGRTQKEPPAVVWQPGAVQLNDRRFFADPEGDLVRQFLARAFALTEVTSIEINHRKETAIIRFPRERPASEVLRRLTAVLQGVLPPATLPRDLLASADKRRRTTNVYRIDGSYVAIPTEHGLKRLAYLMLAGGSFGMSILGVAVPGIPTVPFVILTSYFLVRSSPTLNERLLRSRLFGPLLRDWQMHGAVRPRVKWISIGATLVILVASVLFTGISGPLLVVVLVMAALGIYVVLRLPTLKEPQSNVPAVSGVVPAGAT